MQHRQYKDLTDRRQVAGCRVPQVRVRSLDANLGSSERPKNSVQHSNCPLKPTPGLSGPPVLLSAFSQSLLEITVSVQRK
jgi:hypothetical protein